jgi:hypothetical protein
LSFPEKISVPVRNAALIRLTIEVHRVYCEVGLIGQGLVTNLLLRLRRHERQMECPEKSLPEAILQKIKVVSGIFKRYLRLSGLESMSMKCKDLVDFGGVKEGSGKKGGPKKRRTKPECY